MWENQDRKYKMYGIKKTPASKLLIYFNFIHVFLNKIIKFVISIIIFNS